MITHSTLSTSHQRSIPSRPPVINLSPLELQASTLTTPGWPSKVCTRCPLCTSHTNSSPLPMLPPQLASSILSGLQATRFTKPQCPFSWRRRIPSLASHKYTHFSSPPAANHVPSGLQDT